MRSSPDPQPSGRTRFLRASWPWLVLATALVPAIGYLVLFPTAIDREFPTVERPVFSAYPPAAYRVAEPGDTLDRVAMYLASIAVACSAFGVARMRKGGPAGVLWIAGLGVSIAGFWAVTNPWPTFDGWHGLGWRVVFDPSAPAALRGIVAVAAVVVLGMIAVPIARVGRAWSLVIARGKANGVLTMLAAAAALAVLRVLGWPAVEPEGYWTRWAAIGSAWLFLASVLRSLPPSPSPRAARIGARLSVAGGTVAMVAIGLSVFWFHRPLERFRAIDPGKIYISAMPHGKGLEILQRRHGFKTIINLFQEDLPGLRSPHVDDEMAFAEAHGITYVGSPAEATKAEAFMDTTLRLATDPDAWPVLLHCHACMDRTPAWWGIYRFHVLGEPLVDALRGIEQHRGSRPKGSVTLLYNRVLARLEPERSRTDPTAEVLRKSAGNTPDPYEEQLERELRLARDEARSTPASARE